MLFSIQAWGWAKRIPWGLGAGRVRRRPSRREPGTRSGAETPEWWPTPSSWNRGIGNKLWSLWHSSRVREQENSKKWANLDLYRFRKFFTYPPRRAMAAIMRLLLQVSIMARCKSCVRNGGIPRILDASFFRPLWRSRHHQNLTDFQFSCMSKLLEQISSTFLCWA